MGIKIKMDSETRQQFNDNEANSVVPPTSAGATDVIAELHDARWSVVTFESCAAKNLTYEKAVEKLKELRLQNVSGLCIVTDEAAEKIDKKA